ncbi:MAG: DNA repair protein RadA, partial [Lachnospiraceae bacterium]|nr:DNA repair protein RadA [Lachnospiraceae bacterium]
MAKSKTGTVFYCQNCGHESSKWVGQCPACKEWNSMVEEKVPVRAGGASRGIGGGAGMRGVKAAEPSNLSEVSIQEEERMQTRIA